MKIFFTTLGIGLALLLVWLSVSLWDVEYDPSILDEEYSEFPEQTVRDVPSSINDLLNVLLPTEHRERIAEIVSESDGFDGDIASVEPLDTTGKIWRFYYDPKDVFTPDGSFQNTDDLLMTLVHEYAHILTLNETQVNHIADDLEYFNCIDAQILVDEGCAKETSYLTVFVRQFWTETKREEAHLAAIDGEEEDFAYDHYTSNRNNFVTEYAATNAVEDIAESFAFFVLKEEPAGLLLRDDKVRFFYQYPELVSLRAHMRDAILETFGSI